MTPGTLFLIFIIALVLLLLVLIIYFRLEFSQLNSRAQINIENYLGIVPAATWSPAETGPDAERNVCALYTFSGSQVQTSEGVIASLAQPSLDPQILNILTPQTPGTCFDVDQIVAIQVEHTCLQNPRSSIPGSCVGFSGQEVAVSESEVYYSTSLNPQNTSVPRCNTQACSSTLGVIVSGFEVTRDVIQPQDVRCFNYSTAGAPLFYDTCQIASQEQLFRFRFSLPTLAVRASGLRWNADLGSFVTIQLRSTGQYLTGYVSGSSRTVYLGTEAETWGIIPQLRGSTYSAPQQLVYLQPFISNTDFINSLVQQTDPDTLIQILAQNSILAFATYQTGFGTMNPYYYVPTSQIATTNYRYASGIVPYELYNQIIYKSLPYNI